ncbi:hypothetical protein [Paenibacillus sp. LjRoot56]|uniref:hypothetical protein n=1 Tax=Paenibacillus sp. LjRoot56 TaxID=3342333 RepID=UPI003ECD3D98
MKSKIYVIDKIRAKMDWVSGKSRNKIPYTTINGVHDNRIVDNPRDEITDGINWWTNGFWAAHESGKSNPICSTWHVIFADKKEKRPTSSSDKLLKVGLFSLNQKECW